LFKKDFIHLDVSCLYIVGKFRVFFFREVFENIAFE
jgi:hypothetical protein